MLNFILLGCAGLLSPKSPGRPSKLTKAQKKELDKLITKGPEKAGFPGACWRSPMIQELILFRFGKFFPVYYIFQLLKNVGFSYQKAKFDAAKKDKAKRKEWLKEKWAKYLKLAKEKNSYILFGDEASFPQWGTLSYTWAKRGKQPVVKTSGLRKGKRNSHALFPTFESLKNKVQSALDNFKNLQKEILSLFEFYRSLEPAK